MRHEDFESRRRRIQRQGALITWVAHAVIAASFASLGALVVFVVKAGPEGLGALVGRFLRAAGVL